MILWEESTPICKGFFRFDREFLVENPLKSDFLKPGSDWFHQVWTTLHCWNLRETWRSILGEQSYVKDDVGRFIVVRPRNHWLNLPYSFEEGTIGFLPWFECILDLRGHYYQTLKLSTSIKHLRFSIWTPKIYPKKCQTSPQEVQGRVSSSEFWMALGSFPKNQGQNIDTKPADYLCLRSLDCTKKD